MARNLNHLCSASRHPVRVAGLEPARGRPRGILSLLQQTEPARLQWNISEFYKALFIAYNSYVSKCPSKNQQFLTHFRFYVKNGSEKIWRDVGRIQEGCRFHDFNAIKNISALNAMIFYKETHMDYQLEVKQIVDYPRCRIYREFIRSLMEDRNICTNRSSHLFLLHDTLLLCQPPFLLGITEQFYLITRTSHIKILQKSIGFKVFVQKRTMPLY